MFLTSPLMWISLLLLLYGIHTYLYLPDETFHVIWIHFFGRHLEPSANKLVYDSINFTSYDALKFTIIWSSILFIFLCISVWYIKFLGHLKGTKKERWIKFSIAGFVSLIIYFVLVISSFTDMEYNFVKNYFSYTFKNDLTDFELAYENISHLFYNVISWWSWPALSGSILCLIFLYVLCSIVVNSQKRYIKLLEQNEEKTEHVTSKNIEVRSSLFSDNTQKKLGNETGIIPEKIESGNIENSKKEDIKCKQKIDHVPLENPVSDSIKRETPFTQKIVLKNGMRKLRMVHKVSENELDI